MGLVNNGEIIPRDYRSLTIDLAEHGYRPFDVFYIRFANGNGQFRYGESDYAFNGSNFHRNTLEFGTVITIEWTGTPVTAQPVLSWKPGLFSYNINHVDFNNLTEAQSLAISLGEDTANSGNGNDIVVLRSAVPNTFNAGADNDIVTGGRFSDTIDGGTGLDIVNFSGIRSEYSVRSSATNVIVTDTISDRNGADTLISVERIKFSDGVLAFDTAAGETSGSAYRLYQAAFDRVPDNEGLGYWISRLDSRTTSLNAVAESFLASPEFVSTYGTPQTVSNTRYIELLYTHTLGRNYDQSGLDYWVKRLDEGATNRGDLLAFFSESNENQARVADSISDGIWFV